MAETPQHLDQLLAVLRKHDVVSFKDGTLELVIQPKVDLSALKAPPEDLGLPDDPGDPALDQPTSPVDNDFARKNPGKRGKPAGVDPLFESEMPPIR